MNLQTIIQVAGSTGVIVFILVAILQKYTNDKLKGEIDKDVEEFKGKVTTDIEILKIKENRLDIRHSKYVDVITAQRIEWLEKIRVNVSEIISSTKLVCSNHGMMSNYFSATVFNYLRTMDSDEKSGKGFFDEYITKYESKTSELSKLLYSISMLKMRVNHKDDTKIISLLESLEELIQDSNINIEKIEITLKTLVTYSQGMLKDEWDKVKREVESKK